MAVTQLSVIVANAPGKAADIFGALARAKVDLRAVSVAENADIGVVRIVVKDVTKTKAILKKKGLAFTVEQVLAVALQDKPGALAKMLAPLAKKKINVEYLYGSACGSSAKGCDSVIILRVKEVNKASAALKKAGYKLTRP